MPVACADSFGSVALALAPPFAATDRLGSVADRSCSPVLSWAIRVARNDGRTIDDKTPPAACAVMDGSVPAALAPACVTTLMDGSDTSAVPEPGSGTAKVVDVLVEPLEVVPVMAVCQVEPLSEYWNAKFLTKPLTVDAGLHSFNS